MLNLANKLVQKGFEQAKKFSLEQMAKGLMSVYMKAIKRLTINV